MKQSWGLLETKGMVGAITAVDSMVKAANVHVLGIQKVKGFGWITVIVGGDVGAVQSAIETGASLLRSMGLYVSAKIIPRPAEGLEAIFTPQEPIKEDQVEMNNLDLEDLEVLSTIDVVESEKKKRTKSKNRKKKRD